MFSKEDYQAAVDIYEITQTLSGFQLFVEGDYPQEHKVNSCLAAVSIFTLLQQEEKVQHFQSLQTAVEEHYIQLQEWYDYLTLRN